VKLGSDDSAVLKLFVLPSPHHTHTTTAPPLQDMRAQGSVLFTYVHSDEFSEREEVMKRVTTSDGEHGGRLFRQLLLAGATRGRQEVGGVGKACVPHRTLTCFIHLKCTGGLACQLMTAK
jgi:hypothetical protein